MSDARPSYRQLVLVSAARTALVTCNTVTLPFIIPFVRDLLPGNESQTSFYAGIIGASVGAASFISAIPLGTLSDHTGRRPMMLLGMVAATVSLILFGFSNSILWAALSQSLFGFLDVTSAVSKVMASELSRGSSEGERARAFSIIQVSYGLGHVIGPLVGSALVDPVSKYPDVFQQDDPLTLFLETYPYFLPCFTGATLNAVMIILSVFYMEETCVQLKASQEKGNKHLLLQHVPQTYATFGRTKRKATDMVLIPPSKWSLASVFSLRDCLTPAVLSVCIIHACTLLQLGYKRELLPIWMTFDRQYGGLGFTPKQCAIALASQGMSQIVVLLFILAPVTRRFGTLRVTSIGSLCGLIVYGIEVWVRPLYDVPDLHGRTQTHFWELLAAIILINNAAPQHVLGKTNSIIECIASAMFAVGPALCGMVWSGSLSLSWLPIAWRVPINWVVPAAAGTCAFIVSKRLNPMEYIITQSTPATIRREQA